LSTVSFSVGAPRRAVESARMGARAGVLAAGAVLGLGGGAKRESRAGPDGVRWTDGLLAAGMGLGKLTGIGLGGWVAAATGAACALLGSTVNTRSADMTAPRPL
jgi:hypothetical protein